MRVGFSDSGEGGGVKRVVVVEVMTVVIQKTVRIVRKLKMLMLTIFNTERSIADAYGKPNYEGSSNKKWFYRRCPKSQ